MSIKVNPLSNAGCELIFMIFNDGDDAVKFSIGEIVITNANSKRVEIKNDVSRLLQQLPAKFNRKDKIVISEEITEGMVFECEVLVRTGEQCKSPKSTRQKFRLSVQKEWNEINNEGVS